LGHGVNASLYISRLATSHLVFPRCRHCLIPAISIIVQQLMQSSPNDVNLLFRLVTIPTFLLALSTDSS